MEKYLPAFVHLFFRVAVLSNPEILQKTSVAEVRMFSEKLLLKHL